ncbi:unnamed protein product, partial [Strongylus vulgaris]
YRAWAAQLEGKENQVPSSSADESGDFNLASRSVSARMPTSSTPARQPTMTARSSAQFEPPSRSSTMESVESSSTNTRHLIDCYNRQMEQDVEQGDTQLHVIDLIYIYSCLSYLTVIYGCLRRKRTINGSCGIPLSMRRGTIMLLKEHQLVEG